MLSDVLTALALTRDLAGIMMVTVDRAAMELGRSFGAQILAEGATDGPTAAVHAALADLLPRKIGGILTIPGDVPGVTATELEALLQVHPVAPSFTIVPAHDRRGSNAVLCTPADIVPLKFGENSFPAHLASARLFGIEANVVSFEGLGLDIDNPDDLFAFANKRWSTKTTEFLDHLGIRVHGASPGRLYMAPSPPPRAAGLDGGLHR